MKLAREVERPIFSFIDTPAAYQALMRRAWAGRSHRLQPARDGELTVPIIVTVIGEGRLRRSSGDGVGDQVLMLENAKSTQ